MAATYTAGSTADLDRARLYLYDIDVDSSPLFQDEEWNDFLASEGSVYGAVALACETMANRSARKIDFTADGSAFSASAEYEHWMKQAQRWRAKGLGVTVVVPTRVDGYSMTIDADDVNTNDATFPPA
ncbi:hypothetical protein CMI37_14460 [Candidatus Pacearchaeota archaeon]|nr:hypothetical protein [Candidatus Pacearchaeota archaeon]|tara:strand:- start:1040 stop:1423 length:384 start_codon:yes stop_codon:yes gene_type:complete